MRKKLTITALSLSIIYGMFRILSGAVSLFSVMKALSETDSGTVYRQLEFMCFRSLAELVFCCALVGLSVVSIIFTVRDNDRNNAD